MTKPIRLMTDTSIPTASSAKKPPVNASGMVNMTMNGDFSDWNCATIMRYTSTTPSRKPSSGGLSSFFSPALLNGEDFCPPSSRSSCTPMVQKQMVFTI